MAPRRRPSRKKQNGAADGLSAKSHSDNESGPENPGSQNNTNPESCPACNHGDSTPVGKEGSNIWIRCDACKLWFHWSCVAEPSQDHESVANWFCTKCRQVDPSRAITFKPPARKSSRKKAHRDYASLHAGLESDPDKWMKLMEGKQISEDRFLRLTGSDVTVDWVNSNESAFREPVVVEDPEGLGMSMPGSDFQVKDVLDVLGGDIAVEVIDVNTQSNSPNWNLEKWVKYYYTEPQNRDKIRNVISLEISNTELSARVTPPRFVRELDWVEKFWPPAKRGKGQQYPKVQLYCLMGVARAWTDWHIDFAGSSVYYHVLQGVKTFYFISPTASNLAAYERWSGSETQNQVWLGDMVDEVIKVTLKKGNTMMIPTGWIHAVYTPEDSLVFGGNFLHSYDMVTQLRVREIEIVTHVPKKFRFPFFAKLCWYAGEKYLRDLKSKEEFPSRVLESIEALANFLVSEARIMEKGGDAGKKEAREMVPADRVKDPAALARELRWRIRLAMGAGSGDEGRSKSRPVVTVAATNGATKRKREAGDIGRPPEVVQMKHYKPREWDMERRIPGGLSFLRRKAAKPDEAKAEERWIEWDSSGMGEVAQEGDDEAEVEVKRDVTVRARRYVKDGMLYLERHRSERVLEIWRWDDATGVGEPEREPSDQADATAVNGLTGGPEHETAA